MIEPIGHSPLGGSSMARAIACSGSAVLSYGVRDEEDDTFSAPGTVAHHVGEGCLQFGANPEAWRWIGMPIKINDMSAPIIVDKEIVDNVQIYINHVLNSYPDRNQGNSGVEDFIHAPSIHQYFWMACDNWYANFPSRHLYVDDYKHGAGIVVEAVGNVQMRYYACGIMEKRELWDKIDTVTMTIVQPRGWHFDGPIRSWTITTEELQAWLEDELIPAMDKALVSRDTKAGPHCRFCPAAGRQCPAILSATEELFTMIEQLRLTEDGQAAKLTPEQMSRFADLQDILKVAGKHVERAIFGALQAGISVTNRKLAEGRKHRAWKDDKKAEQLLVKQYGEEAYKDRELRSPAEIEALPGGKTFTTEHAFKPKGELTVVPATDARKAVNKDVKSMFKPVVRGRK